MGGDLDLTDNRNFYKFQTSKPENRMKAAKGLEPKIIYVIKLNKFTEQILDEIIPLSRSSADRLK